LLRRSSALASVAGHTAVAPAASFSGAPTPAGCARDATRTLGRRQRRPCRRRPRHQRHLCRHPRPATCCPQSLRRRRGHSKGSRSRRWPFRRRTLRRRLRRSRRCLHRRDRKRPHKPRPGKICRRTERCFSCCNLTSRTLIVAAPAQSGRPGTPTQLYPRHLRSVPLAAFYAALGHAYRSSTKRATMAQRRPRDSRRYSLINPICCPRAASRVLGTGWHTCANSSLPDEQLQDSGLQT
jgi:hypothetical protein